MIEINKVYKAYDEKDVLKDVSLKIEKGSIFGLIGENGAGKTTLIKCLAGIFKVDKGEIKIEGREVFENSDTKGRIGYVADQNHYFSSFKVKELVHFYKNTYKSFSMERFRELNKIFKIEENKRIRELSKGMKMRVSLMMNLSIMPEILVLDEPTSGLDPIIKKEVMNLILDEVAERNITVFISSHNLSDLERICDSVAIIEKGKIQYVNSIENMKKNIKKLQVLFKNLDQVSKELNSLEGILSVESIGRIVYVITKEYSMDLEDKLYKLGADFIEEIPLSLEDMFIYSVEGGKTDEKVLA